MAAHSIPDLGSKVSFVSGHSEFIRIRQMLKQSDHQDREPALKRILGYVKQKAIADYLCISPQQWSRMQKGREAINDTLLGRLSEYLDVDRICDFLIWTRPYDAFVNTLTTLGYGRLRYRTLGPPLGEVLDSLLSAEQEGLRIIIVESPLAALRGIGALPERPGAVVELRPGDLVRIGLAGLPGLAHLTLLSRDPGDCYTLLTARRSIRLDKEPAGEILLPAAEQTYPVGRPFGPHKLYAIQTATALPFPISSDNDAYPMLAEQIARELRDRIAGLPAQSLHVRCLDYEVVR